MGSSQKLHQDLRSIGVRMAPLISVNLQMASNITPGLLSCSIEYQFRQTTLAALILSRIAIEPCNCHIQLKRVLAR